MASITLPGTAQTVHETFRARPDQVGAVRRWVRAQLVGHPCADDAEATASEFAANAVEHSESGAGGEFIVSVQVSDGGVRVDVTDAGSPQTVPHLVFRPDPAAGDRGRGLRIVAELSSDWGYNLGSGGCTTWCVLAGS